LRADQEAPALEGPDDGELSDARPDHPLFLRVACGSVRVEGLGFGFGGSVFVVPSFRVHAGGLGFRVRGVGVYGSLF